MNARKSGSPAHRLTCRVCDSITNLPLGYPIHPRWPGERSTKPYKPCNNSNYNDYTSSNSNSNCNNNMHSTIYADHRTVPTTT